MPSICATHFCSTRPSFDWARFLQKYRSVGDVPPSPRRSATVFSAPFVGLVNDKLKVCKQCGMDARLFCLVGAVAVVVSDADEIQGRWNVNTVLAMTNGEQRPLSN